MVTSKHYPLSRWEMLWWLRKLAGELHSGYGELNWQSGIAPSTETGAELTKIGAADSNYKLHSLLVDISALDNGGVGGSTITIRMYIEVLGTERKVYSQEFIQGDDPDGLWIVNGTVGIHEELRVEVQSDKAPDNGEKVEYSYMLEAM